MIRKKEIVLIVLVCFGLLCGGAYAEELKIGYINMRKAFYEYRKTKEFQKQLEAKDEAAKKEFEKKADEFKKLRDEIDLLSEKAKAGKQEELRKKAKELDEFRRNKSEELIRWRDAQIREINKDLMDTAARYAKANGYDIVLDKMAFVYAPDEYDITDAVLKELNK